MPICPSPTGVVELLRALTGPGDVVAISPSAAGAGHVRLNFGTGPEILEDAVTRMAAAVAG